MAIADGAFAIDQRDKTDANQLVVDLCNRIERMCRYDPLDDKEADDQSILDRNVVFGLYQFFRNKGDDKDLAAKKARATAIRLVLGEVFI